MKQLSIILGALMMVFSLSAQDLTGKITTDKNTPIVFANVIMMDTDSVFITGCVSDEHGAFHIPFSKKAVYLKVSYIGYQDQIVPIQFNYMDVGNIKLREDALLLSEVVVKANLPKTRLKGDAIVTTVVGSLLEKVGTAIDVLSKVPGISLKGEDLNVFGRGIPQVYINGREVRDPSELNQLTSDNIHSVEVITNPGARYDKTVKAVIRIQTKKPSDEGFSFADRANVSYNENWSYLDQLNLYYRRDKWDIGGVLSYSDQSSWRNLDGKQLTYLDHLWEQYMTSSQTFVTRQLTGSLTLNYTLNPEQSFGGNYRYRRYPRLTNDMLLNTDVEQGQTPFEKSRGNIGSKTQKTRHEVNIYYNGKIQKWKIDFNGTWLHTTENVTMQTNEEVQNIQEGGFLTTVHSNANTRNAFFAGKLIASYPLWTGSLSIGSEYTHTSRTSLYQNREGIVSNDDSHIKEDLTAAFAEYERAFGKLSLQAGIRFEHVGFDYYQGGVYQKEQSKNYNNLFPSLSASIPINKVQLQLNYSSEITRPSYQMLRNRIDYVNRYTYESGNSFLLPSITNTLSFTAIYKWWQLYADFEHLNDAFVPNSRTYSEEDPTIALMSTENAAAYNVMNLTLSASPTIGCWSPQFSLEMYKQWFTVAEPGKLNGTVYLNHPSFAARWKNGFELPLGLTLNVDIHWEGRSDRSNISNKAIWWTTASLYKDVLKGQLTFLLQANDIFNTFQNHYFMYFGHLRTMSMNEKPSFRSIGLTIQYKFRTQKSKYKGTGAGGNQKYRL